MPKGDNPNSRANLIRPMRDQTAEERRESARRAGKKSAEVRAARATLTETLKEMLTQEDQEQILNMLIKRTKQGNLKAYELLRDQLGEKPVERVQLAEVSQQTIDDVERIFNDKGGSDTAAP